MMGELEAAGQRLARRGYPLGLKLESDHSFLFYYHEGDRLGLFWRDGRLVDRDDRVNLTVSQVTRLIQEHPERFSPNVVLRPIVQDHILPTAALVVGPGETQYLAQMKEIYPLFGMQMPVLVPRMSLTLLEPQVGACLRRHGVGAEEVWRDPAGAMQEKLAELDEIGIDTVMESLKADIDAAYQRVLRGLKPLGPDLARIARSNSARVAQQVDYLSRKAWQHHKRGHRELVQDFRVASSSLRPAGGLQERGLTGMAFMAVYGRGLIKILLRAPRMSGHQIALISESAGPIGRAMGAP
ncbi:MAG: bacillithiol biosynthesis BshC, partial [Thermaerobacterales bacterium]